MTEDQRCELLRRSLAGISTFLDHFIISTQDLCPQTQKASNVWMAHKVCFERLTLITLNVVL